MLVKGRVVKVVDKVVHRDRNDPETIVGRFRDRYVTTVATLSSKGPEIIQDVDKLTRFMRAHGDVRAKLAHHSPHPGDQNKKISEPMMTKCQNFPEAATKNVASSFREVLAVYR